MKNKGFTLIELLAVIVLLGIIMLIAVPSITRLITKAKIDALKDSTYGVVDAAKLYYVNNSEPESSKIFTLVDGKFSNGEEKLDHKGNITGTGSLVIDPTGDITVCINSKGAYSYKNYNTDVVSSGLGDSCQIENNFIVNKYTSYLASEGSIVNDYYTKSETNNLLGNYISSGNLNSVSAETYQSFDYTSFSVTSGSTKSLTDGTSKFGSISGGKLTFSESGLYYVSSNLVVSVAPTSSGQIYNSIFVNDVQMTQAFVQATTSGLPATAFFYAKAGDTVNVNLKCYNSTVSITNWMVKIYKML